MGLPRTAPAPPRRPLHTDLHRPPGEPSGTSPAATAWWPARTRVPRPARPSPRTGPGRCRTAAAGAPGRRAPACTPQTIASTPAVRAANQSAPSTRSSTTASQKKLRNAACASGRTSGQAAHVEAAGTSATAPTYTDTDAVASPFPGSSVSALRASGFRQRHLTCPQRTTGSAKPIAGRPGNRYPGALSRRRDRGVCPRPGCAAPDRGRAARRPPVAGRPAAARRAVCR